MFPTKILLATEGSEDAELATRIAADLSTRAGSELHVVYVLEPLPRYSYPGVKPDVYSYVVNEQREEGRKLLDEQVERITESGAQIHRAHLVAAPRRRDPGPRRGDRRRPDSRGQPGPGSD